MVKCLLCCVGLLYVWQNTSSLLQREKVSFVFHQVLFFPALTSSWGNIESGEKTKLFSSGAVIEHIINFQTCSSQSSFFDHFFIDLFHLCIHAVHLHSWKAMLGLITGKVNTVDPVLVLSSHLWEMAGLWLNPITPKSDKHLTSLYTITTESHINVMRIREMTTN